MFMFDSNPWAARDHLWLASNAASLLAFMAEEHPRESAPARPAERNIVDLSRFTRRGREAIIRRRAEKLAERGLPPEHWNESRTQLVDRDRLIVEAVEKAVKRAITEAAPAAAEPEQPPATPATPEPTAPERPLHELSLDEMRAATREHLNRLLDHFDGEQRPGSPFWRGTNRPEDTTQ